MAQLRLLHCANCQNIIYRNGAGILVHTFTERVRCYVDSKTDFAKAKYPNRKGKRK